MFNCNRCGECCRNLNLNDIYKKFHNGDGVCRWLNEYNECTIYETRPLMCRVDEGYYKFFKEYMTIEEYYESNSKICKEFRRSK